MKHIKKYKLFESVRDADIICKKYDIKNYTINQDGTIDVNGDVDLSYMELEKIPIKFGHVTGSFWCHRNQLTTLEGGPRTVGDNFWCNNNQLTTLEGGPRTVGGIFFCSYNRLTTLVGAPKSVGQNFRCDNNQLLTLEGLTDVSIGGRFKYVTVYLDSGVNPIYRITGDWLIDEDFPNMDRIELFNDVGIVVGNKIYLPKLEYFHDEIGVPLPDLDEVKKYYEIIE